MFLHLKKNLIQIAAKARKKENSTEYVTWKDLEACRVRSNNIMKYKRDNPLQLMKKNC